MEMLNLHLSRTMMHILASGGLFLLLVLAGFQAIPILTGDDAQYVFQAEAQKERCSLFVTSALTLEYRPISEHTQALSDMQVTLPLFQQQQAFLLTNPLPDVQAQLQVSHAAYLAIVAAVSSVTTYTTHKVDQIQVNIIMQNNRDYLKTIGDLIMLLQQHEILEAQHLFFIELFIEILLAIGIVLFIPIHARC